MKDPFSSDHSGAMDISAQAKQAEKLRRERLIAEIEAIENALLADMDAPTAERTSAPPVDTPPPPVQEPITERPINTTSNLLEQLRAQAQARTSADVTEKSRRQTQLQDQDRALREIYSYCHDLAQQLNVLHPPVSREYFLAGDLVFKSLQWEHGRADYRTAAHTERQLYRQVSFSWRLSAPTPLSVEREGPGMERLSNLLYDNGVHFDSHEIRNATRRVERTVFKIPATVPCGSRWEADPETGLLKITFINLDRFSVLNHTLMPTSVSRELLDDFGALLLGMPNTFLRRLDRA